MKATAQAPANIAFIKYWGKADPSTRIPRNSSISMNLSDTNTVTTVEFSKDYKKDTVDFPDEKFVSDSEKDRIIKALSKIREKSGNNYFAKVVTRNNFPKGTGIASSASGFASLSKAAFAATGYKISDKDLSKFCRSLSGSSCRSIPDGITKWQKGKSENDSYAYQLYPPDYWEIRDVLAIVTKKAKKISSTAGHDLSVTSPFYESRINGMDQKLKNIEEAIKIKNFSLFGRILEDEALNMHAVCITSKPPIIYWEPATVEIMKHVIFWRNSGVIESYFTIDAGPSVHVICESKNALKLKVLLSKIKGVQKIIINKPTQGARLINEHLF